MVIQKSEIMIKNIGLIVGLSLLAFTTNTFAQDQNNTDSIAIKYNEVGSELPEVRIETEDSTFITNSDLETENNLFLIAFNPNCGHCIREGKLISKNAERFKDTKVVFVANPNRKADLPKFIKETHLDQNSNFLIGVDRIGTVRKLEIYGMFPHIVIYDKDHKLVKIFKGNTSIEDLEEYLP